MLDPTVFSILTTGGEGGGGGGGGGKEVIWKPSMKIPQGDKAENGWGWRARV